MAIMSCKKCGSEGEAPTTHVNICIKCYKLVGKEQGLSEEEIYKRYYDLFKEM